MHLGMGECHLPFSGHCDLDLWPSFNNNCVRSISLILFEIKIPKLVCGCNFWWRSVTYHFWDTLTLTSDLVCTITMSRIYLLYYLRWESQICCMDTSYDADVSHTIFRSLWCWPMTKFLEWSCPEHISYIIWCRNPKFGVLIPLGMADRCIPFWVTFTFTLTSGLISRFFVSGAYLLYYS